MSGMEPNPYESPSSTCEAAYRRSDRLSHVFAIYRVFVVCLSITVFGMSIWLSLIPGSEQQGYMRSYEFYVWTVISAMFTILLLPMRLLYLLIRCRFAEAAIDAGLLAATFIIFNVAIRLVPVSA